MAVPFTTWGLNLNRVIAFKAALLNPDWGWASTTLGSTTRPNSSTVKAKSTHPSMPREAMRRGYSGATVTMGRKLPSAMPTSPPVVGG